MRQDEITKSALEAVTKIGLVALLIVWCFEIIHPFVGPIVWGIIIAVGTFPIYCWVQHWVTERNWLAATLMTVALMLILVFPVVFLVTVLIDNLRVVSDQLRQGLLVIPPPPQGIKDWPMIGASIEKVWGMASENIEVALQHIAPQLRAFVSPLLGAAATVGLNIVKVIVAVVLAGVFLAYSAEGYRLSRAIGRRLAGQQGGELVDLAEATMRSVVRGVLGVALIQSSAVGLGLVVAGVPLAGLWTVLALILCIVQIGPMLIMAPAVVYIFSTSDTFPAVLFLIWSIFTGLLDNLLKPLLLGRGLDVPMIVIFMGAIGGLLMSGIIGLFVGAVVLALGFKVFNAWLKVEPSTTSEGTTS
ncbi:AI-2E family transporter [Nitrospira sp. T9]|uniref:AI-2E family transporter n=1 Tax=unclassified Nitrospira TaxID=2652172 RepID=UPI003F9C7D08